jgi:hypothetical protein
MTKEEKEELFILVLTGFAGFAAAPRAIQRTLALAQTAGGYVWWKTRQRRRTLVPKIYPHKSTAK